MIISKKKKKREKSIEDMLEFRLGVGNRSNSYDHELEFKLGDIEKVDLETDSNDKELEFELYNDKDCKSSKDYREPLEFSRRGIDCEENAEDSSDFNAIKKRIIDESLENGENQIKREDLQYSSKESNNSFKPHVIAEKILQKREIKSSVSMELLFIYDPEDGAYHKINKKQFGLEVRKIFLDEGDFDGIWNEHIVGEIFYQLMTNPSIQTKLKDFEPVKYEKYLNVKNGVVDVSQRKLLSHSPKYRFLHTLHVKYLENDDKLPKIFLKMLDRICNNDNDQKLLCLQSMAYLISNNYSSKKAMYYLGEPHTGKSTLIRLISHIVGEEVIMHVPLHCLGDKYALGNAFNARINACGECESITMKSTSILKALLGEDDIMIERKYHAPESWTPRLKLLFAANQLPLVATQVAEEGLYERFLFIQFDNVIEGSERREHYDRYLFEEEGNKIFSLLVDILCSWYKENQHFQVTESSRRLMDKFRAPVHQPVIPFVEKCCKLSSNLNTSNNKLYDTYIKYCDKQGTVPFSRNDFIRSIIKSYPELQKCKKRQSPNGNPIHSISGIGLNEQVKCHNRKVFIGTTGKLEQIFSQFPKLN